MKRRFFLVTLVLVLAFGGYVEAATFSDIEGHWAKDYIEWTAANNIFTGYEDGTFKPDKKITRSEYVTIISKFKGLDNYPDTLNYYDVKADDWFYVYLNDLVNTGLLKNNSTFQGQSLITRDEAFGLLGQLFPNYTPTSTLTFNDNASIKRAKDILVLKDMGIIQGDDYNYLNPAKPLSRSEAATILYKLNVKGIYVNKAELAQAKENRLLSFDFNAVPIDDNFNEELAGQMNQAVDQVKTMMGITSQANQAKKEPTKEELEAMEHEKKVAEAKASPNYIATYEEAKEKFIKTILNQEPSFEITYDNSIYKGTDKSFMNIYVEVADTPLFLGVMSEGGSADRYKAVYKFSYIISKEEAASYRQTIEDIVREVEHKSDYEKAKYIHDWIVNNTSYAYDQYYSGNYQMSKGITAYEPLSIFKYGKGVCSAYATTFDLIAREAGLKTQFIHGDVNNNRGFGWQNHVWNLVEIDGELYHMDATWDDPVTTGGSEMLRYKYFLIDDRTMGQDHRWDESKYPRANSGCLNQGLDIDGWDNERNNSYYRSYR